VCVELHAGARRPAAARARAAAAGRGDDAGGGWWAAYELVGGPAAARGCWRSTALPGSVMDRLLRALNHLASGGQATIAVSTLSAGGVLCAAAAAAAASAGAVAPPSSNSSQQQAAIRLGCIGVGTINSAVVRGLCTSEEGAPVVVLVGPRNAAKSAALTRQFPAQVRQAQSNQAVLDGCDVLLLATPPGPASLREVLTGLRLRLDHHVISLVAGVSYELLQELVMASGGLAERVTVALPLPPAEWHRSTTPVFPRGHALTEALMGRLGTVIPLDTSEQLGALCVGTLMGHFYKTLVTVEQWLVAHGIDPEQAVRMKAEQHL
jgi:pyrroline-5-carboxylate reductase